MVHGSFGFICPTVSLFTLPATNRSNSKFAPENRPKRPKKETIVFQATIFRCELAVSFREGADSGEILLGYEGTRTSSMDPLGVLLGLWASPFFECPFAIFFGVHKCHNGWIFEGTFLSNQCCMGY